MDLNCTRWRLTQLADRDEETRSLLDVGIVKNRKQGLVIPPSQQARLQTLVCCRLCGSSSAGS